ncbi:PREDICTED: LOW QUALITY PROTEIN: 2-aminoethanethiol dioxygenase [Nanorana parkeri]|uniref:LOW QUALITY PROTEIN: 2-aminoethanethiol dioxygenase n=1 Tax=Nanorana parkeri TaxID=125878 RepID=UPI00085495C0|nr:PREDICTED: LOW QUALITY PROTEIN: 2-aminoethanethiol dioxygenase [Nanorana parkeri]
MPRDDMNSPLIQKIARQALLTFRGLGSADAGKGFSENLTQLRKLVSEIRAEDLKIRPRKNAAAPPISVPHNPPVTYMHICETEAFSMGVFLLKGGTSIPLHDHPGMHGMLKVLYGKVRIMGFDKMEAAPTDCLPFLDDGRDCHYYKLLLPASPEHTDTGEADQQAGADGVHPREMWLLEIPQPDDFWCGGEPYPGPKVSM